jgi:peptidoglycan/LPS O-acetylase OafA/YrhL
MGRYSYALYLVHKPLHSLVGKSLFVALMGSGVITFASNVLYIAAMLVVSLTLAVMLHRLIEMPVHRWRERLAGTGSPTTGGSSCTKGFQRSV